MEVKKTLVSFMGGGGVVFVAVHRYAISGKDILCVDFQFGSRHLFAAVMP